MKFLLIVLIGILVFLGYLVNSSTNEMNNWSNKCYSDGGEVHQNGWGWSDHYDCYKDGKIINHVR
jgi:hypothetical protein